MSYAMSGPLQAAIYDALVTDATLTSFVGGDVYDAVPTGTLPETYVSIGRERVSDASDKTGGGALHRRPGMPGPAQAVAQAFRLAAGDGC